MPAWNDMAVVGRIARAHGNRGQVIVDPETDFPDRRFTPGAVMFARGADGIEPLTIETVRFHRGRPIVALAGVDTMDAAERLAGVELRVDADSLQPLPAGAFYHHDLVGCVVETTEGNMVGMVTALEGAAAGSRLVIRSRGGAEILVPFAEEICVCVDAAAKRIVIKPPEGLLELNVTRRQPF